MAKKKHKSQNQLQPTKPKNGSVNSLAFIKEALTLIGGLAGSILAVYGLVKTFKDDAEGFSWLIPVGIVIWLLILWQLFQVRKTTAYSLFIISILLGASGWIGWQSQVKVTEDKVVVLVAQFDGPEEKYGLRRQIMEDLQDVIKGYDDIVIIEGGELVTSSDAARELGEQEKADLVVWAWYRPTENPNITIHFENLSTAQIEIIKSSVTYKPQATLAELESFEVQQRIGSETKKLLSFIAGIVSYQAGDYQETINRFEPFLLEEDISNYIDPITLYFDVGLSYQALGDYEHSIDIYDRLLELDPKNALAYNNRGSAYLYMNDYSNAFKDFDKVIELGLGFAGVYNNRGNAYSNQKNYEHAVKDYDKAIGLDSNYTDAYANRGFAYLNLGNFDYAIQDCSKAIDLNPNYVDAYIGRGVAYAYLKDYDRAKQNFDRAIVLNPNYIMAYYNRGLAYSDSTKYDRAIQDYHKVIELDPNYADAYYSRGSAYSNLKNFDLAIQDYDKAIELNSYYIEAYNNRGIAYLALKDPMRAIQSYDEAVKLNLMNASMYNNLGIAYLALEDKNRAIEFFSKSIELDPNYATAYKNRGLGYQALGKTLEADADLKKFEELTGQKP